MCTNGEGGLLEGAAWRLILIIIVAEEEMGGRLGNRGTVWFPLVDATVSLGTSPHSCESAAML
jgi:hypothetical protein